MINLYKKDGVKFILSNLIFSISTYFVMLVVPYYLKIETLSEFTAIYQIILFYLVIFEFGLSISYVRYKRIYESTAIINSVLQLVVILIILIFSFSNLGNILNSLVNLDKTSIFNITLFLSVISMLIWSFLKSILLSNKKYNIILIFSLFILIFRIFSLLFVELKEIEINKIFVWFFIYPFLPAFFYLIIIHFKNFLKLITLKRNYLDKKFLKIYKYRIKKYINFSFLTFLSSLIYGYTIKILIIFSLKYEYTEELAQIGYAMTFVGIVSIFVMSLRNYYISKFSFTEIKQINEFLKFIKSIKISITIMTILLLLIISIIIYIMKPAYLNNITILYSNIIIISYVLISYFSMTTLLTKTFNENKLELYINLFRAIGVLIITIFILERNFLITLILIYLFIPFMEYIYSKILLNKIKHKGILV